MAVGVVVVGGLLLQATVSDGDPAAVRNQTGAVSTAQLAASTTPITPERLQIPAIAVDANVEPVGVNEEGNMAAPSDWRDVSWYQPGFAPGEQGNAVFSGHLDWDDNQAVFWDLNKLQVGNIVHVSGEDRQLTYMITGTKEYDYQVTDTTPIFGESDVSQIKLITCDGEFIEGSDTYQKRLIVTGQLLTVNDTSESATTTNSALLQSK